MDRVKYFVINREQDTERLASVKSELDRFGISFERIVAFEARDVTAELIADFVKPRLRRVVQRLPDYVSRDGHGLMVYVPEHHRYLVAGEIAIYVSHRLALKAIADADADAGVIFEDDVTLDDDFPTALRAALELGPGPRLVKFEGLFPAHRTHFHIAPAGKRNITMMLKPTTGGAAYLVTREAAARLYERMAPCQEPSDAFLRQYWLHGVDVLEVVPFPVRQLPFPTNVPQRGRRTPTLPFLTTAALAIATPFLKSRRLLRRSIAMIKQVHRLPKLRLKQR